MFLRGVGWVLVLALWVVLSLAFCVQFAYTLRTAWVGLLYMVLEVCSPAGPTKFPFSQVKGFTFESWSHVGNLAAEPNILVRRQRVRFWIGTGRASKVYPAHCCSLSSTEKSPLTACRGSGSTTIRKA